jgi:hypothetical protein
MYSHEIETSYLCNADDYVVGSVSDSEGGLYETLCIAHNTTKQFGLKIPALKPEVTAFKVRIRRKVVQPNTSFEQVSKFTGISYEEEKNVSKRQVNYFAKSGNSEQCYEPR